MDTGVEQQQQSELAAAAQQSEAQLREVESELASRVKAVSQLLDHTAKAGSQAMSHVAHLEARTQADIAGMPFAWMPIRAHDCMHPSQYASRTKTHACMLFKLCGKLHFFTGAFFEFHGPRRLTRPA